MIEDDDEDDEEPEEEDILVKCERISRGLRGILSTTREQSGAQGYDGGSSGQGAASGDADSAAAAAAATAKGGSSGVSSGAAGPGLVTRSQLVEACGERANQLKHYQVRAEVEGSTNEMPLHVVLCTALNI